MIEQHIIGVLRLRYANPIRSATKTSRKNWIEIALQQDELVLNGTEVAEE